MNESKAWWEGLNAGYSAATYSTNTSNPYEVGTEAFNDWAAGFEKGLMTGGEHPDWRGPNA